LDWKQDKNKKMYFFLQCRLPFKKHIFIYFFPTGRHNFVMYLLLLF